MKSRAYALPTIMYFQLVHLVVFNYCVKNNPTQTSIPHWRACLRRSDAIPRGHVAGDVKRGDVTATV